MTEQVEHEVIRKAMTGNTDAFREIVNHYQAFAYAVSFRFLNNAEDSEDVVQEAFIRLWKNMSKYRPEIKITTWLYRIIANLCLDFLKSVYGTQRKNQVDVEYATKLSVETDQSVHATELNILIQEAAAGLTPKQKAVFILRDLEGLDVEEVCNILSMSAGNMKSNLYYARKQVSERLKKYYQTTDKFNTL